MSFCEKINELNQFVSFNIFGFNGFLCVIEVLYLMHYYKCQLQSSSITWGDAFTWLTISLSALVLFVFVIAFIIFLFERVFYFKIKNKFLVENKFLKIIRYIGFILSLIYLSLLFVFLFIVPNLP